MSASSRPRSTFRRLERWAVGLGMGFLAFFVEKAVQRAIRTGSVEPRPIEATPIRAVGTEAGPVEPPGSSEPD
ncbi:MAG: hypothetical protein ACE14W_08215 [Candidatus Velamenicoccus archaeovorus]